MGNVLHLEQFKFETSAIFHPDRFNASDLALHIEPSFRINDQDKIFVIGSCFAANVCKTLVNKGLNATDASINLKYNTFSMLQTINWALDGGFNNRFLAQLIDGRWFDGHRHPFVAYDCKETAVQEHLNVLAKARDALETADVVVLTLGLVEAWFDSVTNVWLNQTPPIQHLSEPGRFKVFQSQHSQNLSALNQIFARLFEINSKVKVICSVSPVPLKATFCGKDVIIENTYSKATLRSVATESIETMRKNGVAIDYFPSYELATLRPRHEVWRETIRDNEPDGRHVKIDFIQNVIMHFFEKHYL